MNNCGRIATDSSQIENAQRIYTLSVRIRSFYRCGTCANLCHAILFGENEGQNCTSPEQILYLEGIDVRVMCRFVLVQHEIAGISGGG